MWRCQSLGQDLSTMIRYLNQRMDGTFSWGTGITSFIHKDRPRRTKLRATDSKTNPSRASVSEAIQQCIPSSDICHLLNSISDRSLNVINRICTTNELFTCTCIKILSQL